MSEPRGTGPDDETTGDPGVEAGSRRFDELMVGFALDELDQAELEELAGLLQGPDATGRAAAAWRVLRLSTDLRVVVPGTFRAEVASRLAATAGSGATQRVLGGIGSPRQRLEEIGPPPPPPAGGALWRGLVLVLVLLAVAGGLVIWALRSGVVVLLTR